MKVTDTQLFPVLSYGCHLWNMKNSSLITTVNTAFRKGIRKGLGIKSRDSISERLEGMFQEASYKIKNLQILFMRRAIVSRNSLTRGLAWFVDVQIL